MSTMLGTVPSIFECPHCGETIDASAETCRFCGATVDRSLALHRAMILSKVNRACSDASYMRSCAMALPVFFILRFIPIPFLATFGLAFDVLAVVIPIWAIIWWSKYSGLESEDTDYTRARKTVKTVGIVVSIVFVLFVVVPFLVVFSISFLHALHTTSSTQ